MKRLTTRPKIIDLPRSAYRIINAPAPPKTSIIITVVVIIVTAVIWGTL